MAEHGILVQAFRVVDDISQVQDVVEEFKMPEYVVKAQILAGGRGKGIFSNGFKGGVKLTKDSTKLEELCSNMLGYKLVTKQTGKDGVMVNKVMIAQALDISRETYLAIVMDRDSVGPVIVGSPQGGMDIEEVAATNPGAIFKTKIDIETGITETQAHDMAKNLGFTDNKLAVAADQIKKLYNLFVKVDATQIEINPFGETEDGNVVCFDAKFNFDDNAEFRQVPIFAMDDMAENDPREKEAAEHDLNYIGMEGNIGCLVNGAGLAMATMDIVKLRGGEPANFLDVGGNVNEDQVYHAFRILTQDPKVKAILVNIFGGIVNCATIANGITTAAKTLGLNMPLIVRLQGTNVDVAKQILADSGLPIVAADDLDSAAQKAVASISSDRPDK